MLPNFFIVGAPKAGTTSVHRYLDQHPQVYMSPVKEPNYFSSPDILAQELYYPHSGITTLEEYEGLFSKVRDETAIGEGSVSYLFYPAACARIKEAVPDARILIFLRDPVERAWSHYLMDHRMGLVDLHFDAIVRGEISHPLMSLFRQQYVALGNYADQVQRFLRAFGGERVFLGLFDDLKEDPSRLMANVFEFLGVASFEADLNREHNVYRRPRNPLVGELFGSEKLRRAVRALLPPGLRSELRDYLLPREQAPRPSPASVSSLREGFRDDVEWLEAHLGRSLHAWRGDVFEGGATL